VQVSYEGKLHFIHHTFTEYYVADYLVNRLTEGNINSQQEDTFTLTDILQKDEYTLIRTFMDSLLSKSKPSTKMLIQYGNRIDAIRNDCLLHRAALEGNSNIIEFLLDSVKAGRHTDTARRLLLGQDTKGRTAWYIATMQCKLDLLQKIWKSAKESLTTEDIKNKLLLATDRDENTIRHWAAEGGKLDVLQKRWELAKENLTKE
jgi:ankyrin repeat protein